MTTATITAQTLPPEIYNPMKPTSEEDVGPSTMDWVVSPDIVVQDWSGSSYTIAIDHILASGAVSAIPKSGRYIITALDGTTARNRHIEIRRYIDEGSNPVFVLDLREPETEFPEDYLGAIRYLRSNGRPALADELVELLREVEEDPTEATASIVSLRDMARFMVEHQEFADPSIGPDRLGVVHTQWNLTSGGLLAISFLGQEVVFLIAKVREGLGQGRNIDERGRISNILKKHGHLVPLRN